jgi:hypothetical protein
LLSSTAFAANLIGLFQAVDQCLQKQLVLPTLALVYTSIDVVSSLERGPNEHVQDYFTRWVEKYLLPDLDSGITAIDIYGARCGILHNFSGTSRLSSQG